MQQIHQVYPESDVYLIIIQIWVIALTNLARRKILPESRGGGDPESRSRCADGQCWQANHLGVEKRTLGPKQARLWPGKAATARRECERATGEEARKRATLATREWTRSITWRDQQKGRHENRPKRFFQGMQHIYSTGPKTILIARLSNFTLQISISHFLSYRNN